MYAAFCFWVLTMFCTSSPQMACVSELVEMYSVAQSELLTILQSLQGSNRYQFCDLVHLCAYSSHVGITRNVTHFSQ